MSSSHEFQGEISMNSAFEQGENVTSSWNVDQRLEIGDTAYCATRLPLADESVLAMTRRCV